MAQERRTRTQYKTEVIVYEVEEELDETTGEWEEVDANPLDEEVILQSKSYFECVRLYKKCLEVK